MAAKLPILLSVPHAGLEIPPEAAPYCRLTREEIIADGDEGAAVIYDLPDHVESFVTTEVARAIVDLNRAEHDRRPDGVVKTETCYQAPVYHSPLTDEVIEQLLTRYYRPYHARLSELAGQPHLLAVDGHTMAAQAPPISPRAGKPRPEICLGDRNGETLPAGWLELLRDCLVDELGVKVTLNRPFAGGYITRTHGREMPWVQIEFTRAAFVSDAEKRAGLLAALETFCRRVSP